LAVPVHANRCSRRQVLMEFIERRAERF